MEPDLITHLASLGYKITHLLGDEYGCTNIDGSLMTVAQQDAMQKATQQWLVRRYYH